MESESQDQTTKEETDPENKPCSSFVTNKGQLKENADDRAIMSDPETLPKNRDGSTEVEMSAPKCDMETKTEEEPQNKPCLIFVENDEEQTVRESETKTKSEQERVRVDESAEENAPIKENASDLTMKDNDTLLKDGDGCTLQKALKMDSTLSTDEGVDTLEKTAQRNVKDEKEQQMMDGSSVENVAPELTLVLFGDSDAVEPGPNLLLDPNKDKQTKSYSSILYDLCGRIISIIDLLGQKNTDNFPSVKGVNAFLLLLPHGQHVRQYESEVQWLESSLGKGALDYLMTVVTHESKENCEEDMITHLKDISGFSAERFHICTKSLGDEAEMLSLLEKIDALVSKNEPKHYSRHKSDIREGQDTGDSSQLLLKPTDHPLGVLSLDITEEHHGTQLKETPTKDEKTNIEMHREALLSNLHLDHKHKLAQTDILQIGPAVVPQQNISESNISYIFLKKLMMLDYKARYVQQQASPKEDHSKQEEDSRNDDISIDAFCSDFIENDQLKESTIHPLDVQMAVFHCSDSFLKQMMVIKLSQCQYALPLLVPEPFTEDIECPLWTFRQIQKTWKKTETKDNSNVVTMKSMSICKAETPMVFCFRLGSPSMSKSQLINTLINDRHSTFFHRNCPGSTKTRLLFDGVAEIAWYCPAGKPNDTFPDCVAFCNLHGDGLTYDKQLKILMDKSSVNLVFVPTLRKDDASGSAQVISALLESPKPLVVLLEDKGSAVVKLKKGKYKVGLKDRGQSDVSVELNRIIRDILSDPHKPFKLESVSDTGVRVDEHEHCCTQGFSAATEIMTTIQRVKVASIKSNLLPCQGKLWHDWCRLNKEQYRLKGHIEKDRSEKQNRLQVLRKAQCDTPHSALMESFIRHLSSLPPTQREYFLKWTQILMDSHFTDELSLILQRYDEKWSELVCLKRKPDKTNEVNIRVKRAELEQISAKLQSTTCGLEHIFREMGQIYEAHKSLKKTPKNDQTDWSKYPELAAELMISGHPMELMDGDAGHVPLIWISSLIDQVIHKLGDKRVFVLSVLGIQSSGKSTMLNAMFGLQFAVSAGRCTRGAFMQLVKLSEDIRKDFKWDYILVVDTEGLRALELEGNATIHHDNELATFVVGVGNMTLVNVFGENPSEMQDVLQIVVQAFMRMKKVKLSPSCVFVHQNVTDVAAVEKNLDGKRKLQDKLDQMAQLAAKEEGSEAVGFSDIIEFDVQKDVKYFAQLWEGSPPMAPPNPGYSECVQDLKSFILSKASKSPGVTLSEFKTKVQDLWNALLNENFVFSFKNTLEITVYRKLETQFEKWTWALRSEILNIENQLHTSIENGKLRKMEQAHIYTSMSKTYGQVTTKMASYFEDEKDKEILIQWKAQFEQRIKNFNDDLIRQVTRKLDELIQQKEACKKVDQQNNVFKSKLLQKSKDLARQLKDQAKDENALKELFECEWKLWVQDLIGNTKPIEDIDFDNDLPVILHELGIEWVQVEEALKSCKYKMIDKIGDYSSYILQTRHQEKTRQHQEDSLPMENHNESGVGKTWNALKSMFGFGSKQPKRNIKLSSYTEEESMRQMICEIKEKAMSILQTKPLSKRGYNQMYVQEVAKSILDDVAEFQFMQKVSFKKEFIVDLLVYVLSDAKDYIVVSHRNFKVNHDAATFLRSREKEYYMIFRSFCKGSSSAVVLAKLICEQLKASMTEAVCNSTAISIAGEMRDNYPAFKESRLNLEKYVLKSLAEKEDFDSYVTYIRNPKKHLENFIKEEVKKYIFKTHKPKAVSLLQKNVDNISNQLNCALSDATEKVKDNANLKVWLEEFIGSIKNVLTFDTACCQEFDINNYDFLKEEIEKGLAPVVKEMKNLPLEKMNVFRLKPDQILIDQLSNCCWETCPYCGAVCTNTVKSHSPEKHSVPYHRPSGIIGWHVRGTVELVIDFCTTLVASDRKFYPQSDSDNTVPYKRYQTAGGKYAEWIITPAGSKLIYWKWFICRFQKELENYHNMKFVGQGDIPSDWRNYTKKEAIESLDEMYNM